MKKAFFIVLAGLAIFAASCRHSPNLDNAPVVSFKNDIQPIFSSNCMMSGCHGGSSGEDEEAFPLDNYNDVVGHVKPGDAIHSSIYRSMTGRSGRLMPPGGMLSDNELQKVYLWIEEGAQNN